MEAEIQSCSDWQELLVVSLMVQHSDLQLLADKLFRQPRSFQFVKSLKD